MDSSVFPIVYPSFSLITLAPDTLLHHLYAQMCCSTFPPHLSISFVLSCTSLPTSLSTVYRSILSPSLSHLHAHHIHLILYPLFYLSTFFHLLYPSLLLLLTFSPYIQKPHGGSASNLHMLGSPFVLLVQGPHNAVSSAQDPLSADLIR